MTHLLDTDCQLLLITLGEICNLLQHRFLYVTVNKPCSQSHVRLDTASYTFQEIITFFIPIPWDLNRFLKQLEAVLQDQLMHSPFLSGKEEINPDGWTWCCLMILLFLGMFISTTWTFMRLSPSLHQSEPFIVILFSGLQLIFLWKSASYRKNAKWGNDKCEIQIYTIKDVK